MALRTSSSHDVEILAADGATAIPLMLARPRDQQGNVIEGAPLDLAQVLAASDNDLPVSKRLVPVVTEDWSGGVGISYEEAPGVYTRGIDYACAAGAATVVTLPGTNNSSSPIVAMAQYQNDLWVAQDGDGNANTPRVMRSIGGTGALTDSLNLGAGEYVRDLLVFDNGANSPVLYASSCSAKDPDPGANGRLHAWNGASWTSTAAGLFGTNSRQRLARVFWTTADGLGDWRMVAVSSHNTIAYTKPGADPMLAASWVEGIRIRTGVNLLRLVASRHHVYATAEDGVFDLDSLGNSPAITGYTEQLLHGANGLSAQYLNGAVYCALAQGLDRIDVDNTGVLQENVGQCAPGHNTPVENRWRGFCTAMSVDQGYLVAAMFNPSTGECGLFWGQDRKLMGINTPNPLAWWGPEVVLTGSYKVSEIRSFSTQADANSLFVAGFQDAQQPVLAKISMPIAGSPIQDLLSGGGHRFATGTPVTLGVGTIQPYSRIQLLPEGFGDRTSKKIIYQDTLISRGLGGGTKLVLEERADAAPASTSWTSSTDITTSPSQTVSPSAVTSGHRIERRISFVNASSTSSGVLDAHRTTAWRVVPSFGVRALNVEWGDGVLDLNNREDDRDPDAVRLMLETLIAAGGLTTLRDRSDHRWSARVEQVLELNAALAEGRWNKTISAKLEVDVIGPLS